MSPRAGGFVALIATALLALATVVPIPIGGQTNAWWSGHPNVEGFGEIKAKDVNITLFTSKGCNTGGDGGCQPVALGGGFRAIRYSELGLIGLMGVATALLALTALRGKSSRSAFAKIVMVSAALAAIGSIVLLVMGTDIKADKPVAVPMGPGLILFFIGTALSLGAAVIALLPQPAVQAVPAMRPSQPSHMTAQQPHQSGGGFDVQALLADDALRPTSNPMDRPQSPGGALPGPAGPLIPPSGPQPLFQSAPQLRPLYEVNGAGFTPPSQSVQFPTRGPTPMPHAAVSAALGFDVTEPAKASPLPPAPPPPFPAPAPASKLPPPTRTKAMSAAPPIPVPRRPPPPATRPPPPSAPTKMSAVVPPPPPPRPLTEDPADLMQTADFEKAMATGDSTDASALPFDTSTAENSTAAFQQEERTDVGAAEEDLATEAREKIDATDQNAPAPRGSKTEVELLNRPSVSQTDVEIGPAPRASTSVISSAAPPPRHTPSPVRAGTPAPEAKVPISTAPESLPPPKEAAVAAGPSPACPQCEAPMNWVEEHLRFFCKSCRMYF